MAKRHRILRVGHPVIVSHGDGEFDVGFVSDIWNTSSGTRRVAVDIGGEDITVPESKVTIDEEHIRDVRKVLNKRKRARARRRGRR